MAGILLGPSFLGIISLEGDTGTFLECTAEVGVIFLMFSAGLSTELSELKENWLAALVVATVGVIVPVLADSSDTPSFSMCRLTAIRIV